MERFTGFVCIIDHRNKPNYFFTYKNGWREHSVRVELIDIIRACIQIVHAETDALIAKAKEAKELETINKVSKDVDIDLGIDSVSVENRTNEN